MFVSHLVNKFAFAYLSIFISYDAHILLIISIVSLIFFFLSNNDISGKDLRAVGCMLPEQPMRPIYLSSSWGIEPAYLL